MFQTSPAPAISQDLQIHFYLKHFRNSTVSYILEETGYTDITEYELLARTTDLFPATISINGLLTSERPDVDETYYAVYELSLHHLAGHVCDRIMEYYIGMNLTDYELLYPNNNTLYVYVPYKSSLVEDEEDEEDADKEEEEVNDDEETEEEEIEDEDETDEEEEVPQPVQKTKRTFKYDSEEDDDEEDYPPLSDWSFKLNITTKNSFVLRPKLTQPSSYTVQDGIVYIPNFGTIPTTWNAPIEGLDRPIYFNQKYGGWIVSLRLEKALIKAGALKY